MYLAEGIKLAEGYKSNQNVLVVGSPGTGKTRGHVVPGVISANGTIVILDPKGEVYDMTSNMMKQRGYNVECIDFDQPFKTTTFYNPFAYIREDENMGDDIIRITSVLTEYQKTAMADPFWGNSAQLLANAIIGYLVECCNKEDRTLKGVMKLIKTMDCSRDDSVLDILMGDAKRKKKDSFAAEQYELFKTVGMSEKTFSSIVITLVTTFSECMSKGMCYLISKNTLNFEKMTKTKTALYIKSSDTDRSKDKIISLLFHQMFTELCHIADSKEGHCLDTHVHFFLDDFGTNLKISSFDNYIAGMRSREMSCSVILQSESQLKNMFLHSWPTIMAACKSYVFLGSNDLVTCKEISERLNRPLDEILYKQYDEVFLFTQGEKPQKCKRYDIKKDMNYHLIKEL